MHLNADLLLSHPSAVRHFGCSSPNFRSAENYGAIGKVVKWVEAGGGGGGGKKKAKKGGKKKKK